MKPLGPSESNVVCNHRKILNTKTYSRQQRLRDLAATCPQEHTEPHRDSLCSTKIRMQPAGQLRGSQMCMRSEIKQQSLERIRAVCIDALVSVWACALQKKFAAASRTTTDFAWDSKVRLWTRPGCLTSYTCNR